jgi:uncharacterized protein YeaO (DUF488 family)
MAVRIVRLGSPRAPGEGLRIGTVRHPPRGVPKAQHASGNWYDVWYPALAPSAAAVKLGRRASDEREWRAFSRAYRREMGTPAASHALDLLAALSRTAELSVGCYCADEARCHRSILRQLLLERGAVIREQGRRPAPGARARTAPRPRPRSGPRWRPSRR